jgi:HAMP domain-containing protein
MEAILVTLAALAGGVCLVFAAHRLGEAHSRLDLLRSQRQRDRRPR